MTRLAALIGAAPFPPTRRALNEPNGLLAIGGDLSVERLCNAYQRGIFPWFSPGEPIMWWSPAPRCVFLPGQFHASRSLQKFIKRSDWCIRSNTAFTHVMQHCASAGGRAGNTWISEQMIAAYTALHHIGYAHSIEVWDGDTLAGGLYGVAIDGVFFAESMFSAQTNGSKIALSQLVLKAPNLGLRLIDVQIANPHLLSLGAQFLKRDAFEALLPQDVAVISKQLLQQGVDGQVRQQHYLAEQRNIESTT